MKKFLWGALAMMMVTALSVGVTSCGDDEDPDEVALTEYSVQFDAAGGSKSISVSSNTSWTISGAQPWLQVMPMQGSGNGSFTIMASENTEKSARTCTLNIRAGSTSTTLSVYQPGKTVDDDPVGSYTGTLKPMGYSDAPARCYVTITRLSSDAVRVSSLICEEFGMDMNPVNMIETHNSDGSISLRSETSYSIEGSYYMGQLTLSFSNSVATFYFTGTKNI